MESSDMKNIVVLKNLPSNLIEEAIVVLKGNVNAKIPQKMKGEQKEHREKEIKKDYIVKEAEMHIAQYVSSVENKTKLSKVNQDFEKKYMRLRKLTSFFAILAILGMVVNLLK